MAKQVLVTRVFNAPIASVWKVWTDAEMVKRWWGPAHFTSPTAKMDFREGGTTIVSMKGPEGSPFGETYSIWQYTKIVLHERIEFVQNLADKDGNKMQPATLGMPADFPEDILTTVTFKALDDKRTEMTVIEHADMGSMSHFAQLGLEQSIDKMESIFN